MLSLKAKVSQLIVKTCRLSIAPEEIGEDTLLFGSEGLRLDSVDALQIVVAIARDFEVDVPEDKMPELLTINRIADFLSSYVETSA